MTAGFQHAVNETGKVLAVVLTENVMIRIRKTALTSNVVRWVRENELNRAVVQLHLTFSVQVAHDVAKIAVSERAVLK